jgi:hypothetical protein
VTCVSFYSGITASAKKKTHSTSKSSMAACEEEGEIEMFPGFIANESIMADADSRNDGGIRTNNFFGLVAMLASVDAKELDSQDGRISET